MFSRNSSLPLALSGDSLNFRLPQGRRTWRRKKGSTLPLYPFVLRLNTDLVAFFGDVSGEKLKGGQITAADTGQCEYHLNPDAPRMALYVDYCVYHCISQLLPPLFAGHPKEIEFWGFFLMNIIKIITMSSPEKQNRRRFVWILRRWLRWLWSVVSPQSEQR